MNEHDDAPGGCGGRGEGAVGGGVISPLPPDSHDLGAMGAQRPATGAMQVVAAAQVATSAAKTDGRQLHHRAAKASAVGAATGGEPQAWRVSPHEIAQVLAFIECGYSLRQAAGAVGRSHTTFIRLRKRDENFDRALRQRRQLARDKPLRQVLQAAERSWRAAAWLLKYLDGQERTPRAKGRGVRGEGRGVRGEG